MTDRKTPNALITGAKNRLNGMPYVLLVITTLTWAGHVVIAKGISGQIPPFSLAFWRCFFAALILLALGGAGLKQDWPVIRRSIPILVLIAAPAIAAFNTFLYLALETTTAVNSGVITIAGPAVIVLLSAIILKQRIVRRQMIGLFFSFAGAMLVVIRGDWRVLAELVFVRGDIWMIAAVSSTALYSVLLHYRPPVHALSLTVCMFCIGTILLLPLYLWDLFQGNLFTVTPAVAGSIFYIAVFPSVVAYFCWNRGIQLVGASRAGLLMSFMPLYVAILAYVFLGEVLFWYHLAGFLLILTGVILFNRKRLGAGK